MNSKIRFLTLLFIIYPTVFNIAQNLSGQTSLQELIQAERDFAQMAKEKGIKAAFLQVLTEEALMFNPLPQPGRKFYGALPDSSLALLIWEPTAADIAIAGDLGYTLGPYEFRAQKTSAKPDDTGHFLTIWQNQPNSIWKVLLDVGTPHALNYTLPILPSPTFKATKKQINTKVNVSQAKTDLLQAENLFWEASKSSLLSAYNRSLSPQAHIFRDNKKPVMGKTAAIQKLTNINNAFSSQHTFGNLSKSGDLGFTYGTAQPTKADPSASKAIFVHIWQKDANNTWKIVADLMKNLS